MLSEYIPMSNPAPFRCKKFSVHLEGVAHPIGTDSMLLGAWATLPEGGMVLDIGTGTGIIALMVAQRLAEQSDAPYQIHGVELHPPSANIARRNAAESPWGDHIHIVESPVQQWQPALPYHLIVSNPPFFNETITAPDAARRQARSTESLSFSDLLSSVARLLHPRGVFCGILPVQEGRLLGEMACSHGLYMTRRTFVFPKEGKPAERMLFQLEFAPCPFRQDSLTLRMGNEYSDEYRALTGDFYL